jgi:ABC-type branched-subunit amino acid transport system substrate-binding protein
LGGSARHLVAPEGDRSWSLPCIQSAVALGAAFAAGGTLGRARAEEKAFRIALNLPFTGGEAEGAIEIKNGVMLAVDEINAKGGAASHKL